MVQLEKKGGPFSGKGLNFKKGGTRKPQGGRGNHKRKGAGVGKEKRHP